MPVLPNFFLVGAPKAGTTSLFRYLGQHPSVFISPVKEPCFFAPEVIGADPGRPPADLVTDWTTYLELFAGAGDERAVGEGSTAYLASRTAAANIAARIPDARILMVLRDPADRLFRHYAAARAAGITASSYLRWLDERVAAEASSPLPFGPIEAGRYAQHLRRYLARFPPARIHVVLYDDYVADVQRELGRIFEFLEVTPTFRPDVRTHHNATSVPRWPGARRIATPIGAAVRRIAGDDAARALRGLAWRREDLQPGAADRARTIELYTADLTELQALLHRDLSGWLSPAARHRAR